MCWRLPHSRCSRALIAHWSLLLTAKTRDDPTDKHFAAESLAARDSHTSPPHRRNRHIDEQSSCHASALISFTLTFCWQSAALPLILVLA